MHAAGALAIHAKDGNESLVQLVGELHLTTADQLRTAIQDLITRNPCDVLLDISALQFCDVEGLRAMVWSSDLVVEHGHTMRIVGARPSIRAVLDSPYGADLVIDDNPDERL